MKTSKPSYLEITQAEYAGAYKIGLQFNTGMRRIVDFRPFLDHATNPDTTGYRSLAKFKSFRVEHGDLVWGDFQMVFPIADLYSGTLLASKQTAEDSSKASVKRKKSSGSVSVKRYQAKATTGLRRTPIARVTPKAVQSV